MYTKLFFILSMSFFFAGCNQKPKASTEAHPVNVPQFNADSAYAYTNTQVAFGPRVPNTDAHVACGNYLANKLREFGANVYEQKADLKNYAGTTLKATNIIGSFKPENPNRVLLFAHWDTRPYADRDPDPANHNTPIDGANDGAGACGVLLEIARQISIQQPEIGVDIIFFDAEDWGAPAFDEDRGSGGYCLGSDFWGQHPHVADYTARYGILLDMVSAPGATFYKEGYSVHYAPAIVRKVWETAQTLGYGHFFINSDENHPIDDDHVYVIKHRKIPCVDIIHLNPDSSTGFAEYWHTLNDNMKNVSRETMQAVGQTVLHVVYNEN